MTPAPRRVHHFQGPAEELHHRPFPENLLGDVWVLEPTSPALVMGSTQTLSTTAVARAEAAGLEVTGRRSGGGAVLLYPGQGLWIDIFVGPEDRLFESDIGLAAHRIGECWAGALADFGHRSEVWTGPMTPGRWGRVACFAGLGPGEVTVAGRKVVGISQRRTRAGVRVQCHADIGGGATQAALVEFLDLLDPEAKELESHLTETVGGISVDRSELTDRLLEHLGTVR